jgi:predicted restriction endonuclease
MKRMIEKNLRSIKIDDNIDKSRFIKIIRPYYYLYLTKMYHVQGVEKTYKSDELLTKKLKELYDYNCSFGRLMLKREPITHKFKYIHDLDHPKFTMKDAMNYEKDLIHNITSNIIYNETNPDTDTIINTDTDTDTDTDSDDEYQMN